MTEQTLSACAQQSDHVVCWSRMQAEAGQELEIIVRRKELERQACDCTFFWGVGNAPSRFTRELAACGADVPVIFSIMRSPPKPQDRSPEGLLVWRAYEDHEGWARRLPQGALVTSRFRGTTTSRHYALMCERDDPLALASAGPFDPAAYRNLGTDGAQIGSSQVTTLARRVSAESADGGYRRDMTANLTGSLWVRLLDPVFVGGERMADALALLADPSLDHTLWTSLVAILKEDGELPSPLALADAPELPLRTAH